MNHQGVGVEGEQVFGIVVVDLTQRCQLTLKGCLIAYGEGDLKVEMDRDGNTTFSNFAPNMDSIEANRLLDRYFTINDAKASSGIGLSISKEIVVEMGGKLKVRLEDNILYISITF